MEAYKGLRVTRPASTIGDDHVERQLQMMQDAHAKEQVVARAAELEDVVLADVEELGENGDPVPDHGSGDQSIRLFKDDEGNPVDFAEQLVGISAVKPARLQLPGPLRMITSIAITTTAKKSKKKACSFA